MIRFETKEEVKKLARTLEKQLALKGHHLAHGEALDVLARMSGHRDWNALSAELGQEDVKEIVPRISSVDFTQVTAVVRDGTWYKLDWHDGEVVSKLKLPLSQLVEDELEETALMLLTPGFDRGIEITLARLIGMHWEPETRSFIDGKGTSNQFIYAVDFADVIDTP